VWRVSMWEAVAIAAVLLSAGGTRAQSGEYPDFGRLTVELRALANRSIGHKIVFTDIAICVNGISMRVTRLP